MELKEYIQVFKKNIKSFLFVIAIFLGGGTLFQVVQPESYKTSLTINITRAGSQETAEYKYDSFYRLQADERFADTVVRWLGSPRISADIHDAAGMSSKDMSEKQLSRALKAQRLSSQVINITFKTSDQESGKKLAKALVKNISAETEKLNKIQKDESWFRIMADEPLIRKVEYDLVRNSLFLMALGIFFGTWIIFIRSYWQ